MSFTETLQGLTGKPLADCTNQELYLALLELVRQKSADRVQPVTGRKLYYISAEFLIGKLLSNNLINLGLYDEARDALAAAGKSLSDIEEVEPEPSLGNGGLGRLAACFLDSLATLNLPGDGVGLRYHFGLFRQSFENGVQNEKPDPWLTAHSWAEKTDITYPVELAGKEYTARLYKLAVTGYEGRTNTLNLFDLDTIDESIVHDGIAFDKTAIDKNLTLFLYPDDSDEAGRRLRVYQQYLMVSAGAQLILADLCDDLHSFVKVNAFFTQQTNQLRDDHAGVGVVDLDGGIVGQIVVIAAPGGTLGQNELGTGRDHQVLLVHPQAAARLIGIVRVEEEGQVLVDGGLVEHDAVMDDTLVNGVKVKQVQGVGAALVAGNGQLVQPGGVLFASQLHRVGDVGLFGPAVGGEPRVGLFVLHAVLKGLAE